MAMLCYREQAVVMCLTGVDTYYEGQGSNLRKGRIQAVNMGSIACVAVGCTPINRNSWSLIKPHVGECNIPHKESPQVSDMKKSSSGTRLSPASPCAACKFLKRRCLPNCIFAPYFLSNNVQRFVNVHKIFGASNVGKLLSEIPPELREDAANSLAYEAEARVRDPVHGCVGDITLLQWKMAHLQHDLASARVRLAQYTNPHSLPLPSSSSSLSSSSSAPLFSNYTADVDMVAEQLHSPELGSQSIDHLP